MKRQEANFSADGWAGSNSSTIEEVAVGDLIIDPDDPWKQKAEDVERAVPFVKRYAGGHVLPVMIDSENRVIVGAAIVEAAKKAGISRLRVVRQVFPDAADEVNVRKWVVSGLSAYAPQRD